jgi:hypothetical protein
MRASVKSTTAKRAPTSISRAASFLPDHLVRGAHDAGHIFGAIEPDPMRREGALKRDEVLGVGIDERAVEIEERG